MKDSVAMLVSSLTRATVPPMRTQRAAVAMSRLPDERPLEAKVIDLVISSFSVLFLPIIAVVGLSLAAATGRWDGGELRIGAPSRAERMSKPTAERPVLPPVLLLSSSQDPVLSDLQDGPAAMLSKPAAEQQRQEGLQALEDERLVTCRASQDFDQACRFAVHQRSSQRLPLRALVTPPEQTFPRSPPDAVLLLWILRRHRLPAHDGRLRVPLVLAPWRSEGDRVATAASNPDVVGSFSLQRGRVNDAAISMRAYSSRTVRLCLGLNAFQHAKRAQLVRARQLVCV